MSKIFSILFVLGVLVLFVFVTNFIPECVSTHLAALVFPERVTPEKLMQAYERKESIKVLIVPGHDKDSWGADFNGVREADLNLEIGEHLFQYFNADSRFQTFISRTDTGYTADFRSYFTEQSSLIREFIVYFKTTFNYASQQGLVEPNTTVYHTIAAKDVVLKLYGINKWANDYDIDIVLHLHFNDYPRRRTDIPGKHIGVSIYIPEKQLPNARASRALVKSVFERLTTYFPPSTLPLEREGIIEDQELIALGAYASLDAASLLIEYGYIYEPQFTHPLTRAPLMRELAFQTYQGIRGYFESGEASINTFSTSLLPYTWYKSFGWGSHNRLDVLALQAALVQEGVYPPPELLRADCPVTGYFGPCTQSAVSKFQKRNALSLTEFVDSATLEMLNELYGPS